MVGSTGVPIGNANNTVMSFVVLKAQLLLPFSFALELFVTALSQLINGSG